MKEFNGPMVAVPKRDFGFERSRQPRGSATHSDARG